MSSAAPVTGALRWGVWSLQRGSWVYLNLLGIVFPSLPERDATALAKMWTKPVDTYEARPMTVGSA